MTFDDEANVVERRRWNDACWASVWPKREAMTSSVTEILLSHLDLRTGERVLDVGSGGGITAIAAVDRVGPGGSVVGADISAPLVELASRRAADRQIPNLSFCVADVQRDTVPGAPFDVAVSQFGVMFFDEPVTAFANIRRHLAPGGRFAFACWQPIERNPWFLGPALADFALAPPPPAPGKSPTGPFSLSDPERVGEILAGAGWKSTFALRLNWSRLSIETRSSTTVSWRSWECPRTPSTTPDARSTSSWHRSRPPTDASGRPSRSRSSPLRPNRRARPPTDRLRSFSSAANRASGQVVDLLESVHRSIDPDLAGLELQRQVERVMA